jgi:hypothetical protein
MVGAAFAALLPVWRNYMKRSLNFSCIVVLLILMNSNWAMSKRAGEDEGMAGHKMLVAVNDQAGTSVSETFLDTLNRGREFALIDKDFTPILAETTGVSGAKGDRGEVPNGFRVQCFASSLIERVRAEQKTLEAKIKYPVYIVFNAPYYKLLIGDFIKRNDADAACAKLKDLGYADAWVLRTKVWASR